MDFFSKLADMESVDLTIRIFKKNDKLTLNLMPGSGNSTTLPILVTGTPSELDEQFFDNIMPQMKEVSGLVTNISEAIADLKERNSGVAKTKADKPAAEKKVEKAVEAKPNTKPSEPDLFGAVAVPAAAAPASEEVEGEEPEEESNE